MKQKAISTLLVVSITLFITGCVSKQQSAIDGPVLTTSIPAWVVTPSQPGALSATACVPATGDLGLDFERADLQATAQLGSMLGLQIQSMRESYRRLIDTPEDGASTASNFESVVRNIVNERLTGVYRVKADYISLGDSSQFCSQIAIGDEKVNELIARVAGSAGIDQPAFTQAQYREMHMSQQAFNRLNERLIRNGENDGAL